MSHKHFRDDEQVPDLFSFFSVRFELVTTLGGDAAATAARRIVHVGDGLDGAEERRYLDEGSLVFQLLTQPSRIGKCYAAQSKTQSIKPLETKNKNLANNLTCVRLE